MRAPLLRLLQEVDTFRSRAIIDTHLTIQAMERERTEYRAALSWMKSASSQLDPDTGRGLDKFRKAQQHVRASKAKFDRYTLDCLQKIDLLAAARCNMFSHALVAYQAGVMEMFVKTNGTFAATIAALDKEPHYSFTVLKELTQGEEGAVADGEKTSKSEAKKTLANTDDANQTDKDHMLFFKVAIVLEPTKHSFVNPDLFVLLQDDYKDDQQDEPKQPSSSSDLLPATLNLMDQIVESAVASKASSTALDGDLLGLAIANDGDEFGEFVSAAGQPILPYMPSQLLMDDMLVDLGNWTNAPDGKDEEPQQSKQPAQLQPLADGENKSKSSAIMDLFGRGAKKSQSNSSVKASAGSKGAIGGKANWMDLFAELDPLANPDLMEKKLSGQHTNNQAA